MSATPQNLFESDEVARLEREAREFEHRAWSNRIRANDLRNQLMQCWLAGLRNEFPDDGMII